MLNFLNLSMTKNNVSNLKKTAQKRGFLIFIFA